MKLWRLMAASPWQPRGCEYLLGIVVRAETEDQARRIANEHGRDERGDTITWEASDRFPRGWDAYTILPTWVWLDPKLSTCKEVSPDGEPGVIMCAYDSAG